RRVPPHDAPGVRPVPGACHRRLDLRHRRDVRRLPAAAGAAVVGLRDCPGVSGRIRDGSHPLHHRSVAESKPATQPLTPAGWLAAQGFDVHATERGGDVTYHGPGQLVGYPILDLGALDEDVVRYVRGLEAALIGALERFGIPGARLRGYPGVWVGDAKVAAIGV